MNLRKITLWILWLTGLLIVLAIADILFIPGTLSFLTPITTLSAFIFAVLHGGQRFGWSKVILLVIVVFIVSIAFESLGVATGKVYGPYHYTDRLGPKFLGLVPYLIPLAWFMMMYSSLVIAERFVLPAWSGRRWRWLAISAVGSLAMTAWDLAMDPMMVLSNHWVWEVNGAYFGVPLQNYWGWWLTTFVALGLFGLLGGSRRRTGKGERPLPPDAWAVTAYFLMGISSVVLDFIVHLYGPGLVGIFAMLPWVLVGYTSASRRGNA